MLFVDEPVLRLDLRAVDAQLHTAERLQLQAGGGDDDVGIDALTRTQHDAGPVEMVDVVGHHIRTTIADGRVQIVVENQAQPLVPRVVAGLEVDVDRISFGQGTFRAASDDPLAEAGRLLGDDIRQHGECGVIHADNGYSRPAPAGPS